MGVTNAQSRGFRGAVEAEYGAGQGLIWGLVAYGCVADVEVLKDESGVAFEQQRQEGILEFHSIAIDADATAIGLRDQVNGFGGGCIVGDRGDVAEIVLGSAPAEN